MAVTGKTDIITNGSRTISVSNGSPKMEDISGTGSMCSAVSGAAAAVANNSTELVDAISSAIALMGISGEKASQNFRGTASMKVDIIDNLSTISKEEFLSLAKVNLQA